MPDPHLIDIKRRGEMTQDILCQHRSEIRFRGTAFGICLSNDAVVAERCKIQVNRLRIEDDPGQLQGGAAVESKGLRGREEFGVAITRRNS
jgi:hypothetical protein